MSIIITTPIVLATHNQHKCAELQTLLPKLQLIQPSIAITVEENAPTFVENALLKARAYAKHYQCAALADDSGICVNALGGRPGIHSSRFAIPDNDAANRAALLSTLNNIHDRRASFFCAIVLVSNAQDPTPLIGTGRWEGAIALNESGDNGFGYDAIFIPDGYTTSCATLSTAEKHRVSHRARAATALQTLL